MLMIPQYSCFEMEIMIFQIFCPTSSAPLLSPQLVGNTGLPSPCFLQGKCLLPEAPQQELPKPCGGPSTYFPPPGSPVQPTEMPRVPSWRPQRMQASELPSSGAAFNSLCHQGMPPFASISSCLWHLGGRERRSCSPGGPNDDESCKPKSLPTGCGQRAGPEPPSYGRTGFWLQRSPQRAHGQHHLPSLHSCQSAGLAPFPSAPPALSPQLFFPSWFRHQRASWSGWSKALRGGSTLVPASGGEVEGEARSWPLLRPSTHSELPQGEAGGPWSISGGPFLSKTGVKTI